MQITEVKRWPDGREEAFTCEALYITTEVAVLRFHAPPDSAYVVDKTVPLSGRTTLAVFWSGRNYLVYKMLREERALLGYRIDVCKDVTIDPGRVTWTDLALDVWVYPSGELSFLDEDEVEGLDARGLLSEEDRAIIAETRELLSRDHTRVIAEVEETLKEVWARGKHV